MVDEANPTFARRALTIRMHTIRELRKRSLSDLAARLDFGVPQASKLDTGNRGYQVEDVENLAKWYDLNPAEQDELLALAEQARQRAWWQKIKIADAYRTLIGMEQSALAIHEYCFSALPGLLQTRAYAEAAVLASVIDATPDMAKKAAQTRMHRQGVLDRADPPQFWAIIDEVALARGAGGSEVMRGQLRHLLDMTNRPGITLQVLAFEYGIHTGPYSHFMLLEMPPPLHAFSYTEDKITASVSSPLQDVPRERELWKSLQSIALSPRESQERIKRYL